jgi:hypothetical protein
MGNKTVNQSIVSTKTTIDPNQVTEETALFNPDGTPFTGRNLALEPITVAGAIGTAAKTTTSAEPAANTIVPLKFTSGNSAASPTVAFNGGTARVIKITLAADGIALFYFDGTVLHQMGVYS